MFLTQFFNFATRHDTIKPAGEHHQEKQRRNPEATKMDTLRSLATHRHLVHKYNEQEQ